MSGLMAIFHARTFYDIPGHLSFICQVDHKTTFTSRLGQLLETDTLLKVMWGVRGSSNLWLQSNPRSRDLNIFVGYSIDD